MKRKPVREEAALPHYLEALLSDGPTTSRAGTGELPGDSFECLAFHVHGLMVAVPQRDTRGMVTDPSFLNRVQEKQREPRQPPDRTGLVGIFRYRDAEIMIVDIADIAIPPPVRAELADARGAPVAVLRVQDGQVGLVCDDVPVSLIVAPQEVCWSSLPDSRPWLAGVISNRYALINPALLCPGQGR